MCLPWMRGRFERLEQRRLKTLQKQEVAIFSLNKKRQKNARVRAREMTL